MKDADVRQGARRPEVYLVTLERSGGRGGGSEWKAKVDPRRTGDVGG